MMMAGIFAVGAAMGLGSTWWMNRASHAHAPGAALHKFEPVKQSAPPARAGAAGPGAAGINPAELPYDGKPHDEKAKAALSMAAIAAQGDQYMPERPASSGGQGLEAAPPNAASAKKKSTAIAADGGDIPAAQSESDTSKKKTAGASVRRRPPASAAERETGRGNQQAAELKRRNRSNQIADASQAQRYAEKKTSGNAPSYAASGGSKRLALARCESASNIFARERCKWQLCNGMWGRNGCPSYD
jgi:hypothetical protein